MTTLLTRVRKRSGAALLAVTKYPAIYRKFKHYTMCPERSYIANLELVDRFAAVSGSIVECGTWRGGMIAGIADLLGKSRHYVLFDSFEGLPAAKEIDGAAALAWQADTESPKYHDNCCASEADARRAMELAGVDAEIHKGWFSVTLPGTKVRNGIAILRMDADWYESTTDILENLFPQVVLGGLVIVDDYYTWDGCSKAVHDFLSKYKRPERIKMHHGVCYIEKVSGVTKSE